MKCIQLVERGFAEGRALKRSWKKPLCPGAKFLGWSDSLHLHSDGAFLLPGDFPNIPPLPVHFGSSGYN